MASLLTIPQELRDSIYTFAITSALPAPPTTSYGTHKQTSKAIRAKSRSTIQCGLTPLPWSCNALQLTNLQISTEVSAWLIRQKKAHALAYSLDCVILNEQHIFPTWLSLPYLSTSIGTVNVNLRIAGRSKGGYETSVWRHGDGGHSEMMNCLWRLVCCFIAYGPVFTGPYSTALSTQMLQTDNNFSVGEVVINVESWSKDVMERDELENDLANWGQRKNRGRPEWIAHQILDHVGHLAYNLDPTHKTTKAYRESIDGRIGTFTVLFNGSGIGSASLPSYQSVARKVGL